MNDRLRLVIMEDYETGERFLMLKEEGQEDILAVLVTLPLLHMLNQKLLIKPESN